MKQRFGFTGAAAIAVVAIFVLASAGCQQAGIINLNDDTGNSGLYPDGGKPPGDGGAGSDGSDNDDSGIADDGGSGSDGGGGTDGGGGADGGGKACKTKDDCPIGNLCIDLHCVSGCEGARDCPTNWKCDTAIPPHGQCVKCLIDTDCGASGFKCIKGECKTSCSGDPDCNKTPSTPKCDTASGICVQCLNDGQCAVGNICVNKSCVEGCRGDRDCVQPLKCDSAYGANGKCFECVTNDHCTGGKVCVDHKCSIDCSKITCPPATPICWPLNGTCVKCYDKSHCKAGEVCRTNVCVTGCDIDADCSGGWKCKKTGNGVCVECLESADCPYGEKCAGNVCVAGGCSSDTECLNGYFCHPKLRTCEPLPPSPCKTNGDCNVIINTKICDPLTRTCIPVCYYVAGFPICLDSARPYCDTSYNGCYECIADSNCDGTDCKDLNNTCVKCAIDFDCKNPAWHCDGISGACYECVNNTHCAPNFCDISNHKCVQCFQNTDCKNPSFPICGKDKTCIPPCTDDCVKDAMKCDPTDSTHETYMTCGDYDNDPCMEWSYSKYCPSHQYCYQSKCICKPAPCSEGQYGCDAQYPTTVYQCTKDSNGCLYWATYMTCTNGSKCGQSGCP